MKWKTSKINKTNIGEQTRELFENNSSHTIQCTNQYHRRGLVCTEALSSKVRRHRTDCDETGGLHTTPPGERDVCTVPEIKLPSPGVHLPQVAGGYSASPFRDVGLWRGKAVNEKEKQYLTCTYIAHVLWEQILQRLSHGVAFGHDALAPVITRTGRIGHEGGATYDALQTLLERRPEPLLAETQRVHDDLLL